jgi:hypothetical protein
MTHMMFLLQHLRQLIVLNNNPSSARNFSEYSTAWALYRVLWVKFSYYSSQVVNTTATGLFGVQSIVHGTPANPASLAQAMSTGVSRPWFPYKAFTRTWRMEDALEATYQSTSFPGSTSNTLVVYGAPTTTGTDIGTIMIEYLVQFKTHTL